MVLNFLDSNILYLIILMIPVGYFLSRNKNPILQKCK